MQLELAVDQITEQAERAHQVRFTCPVRADQDVDRFQAELELLDRAVPVDLDAVQARHSFDRAMNGENGRVCDGPGSAISQERSVSAGRVLAV